MYVLSWRTVSVLTRVLFWYLFHSLLRNSGIKHQNNPLVSAETIRHSSTYIILYFGFNFHRNLFLKEQLVNMMSHWHCDGYPNELY